MKYKLLNISVLRFNFNNTIKNEQNYELNPNFGKEIRKIEKTRYDLFLGFSIHGTEGKQSPFEMDLDIVGSFEVIEATEDEINDFMNLNAVSILFPYLRSTISSAMTAMMVPPLFLPIIDAKMLFKEGK